MEDNARLTRRQTTCVLVTRPLYPSLTTHHYTTIWSAIALPQGAIDRLMEVAKTDAITIDMESMSVTTPFQDRFTFEMDPFRQQCLMEGLDEIDLTLAKSDAIEQHEQKTDSAQPWLTPAAA